MGASQSATAHLLWRERRHLHLIPLSGGTQQRHMGRAAAHKRLCASPAAQLCGNSPKSCRAFASSCKRLALWQFGLRSSTKTATSLLLGASLKQHSGPRTTQVQSSCRFSLQTTGAAGRHLTPGRSAACPLRCSRAARMPPPRASATAAGRQTMGSGVHSEGQKRGQALHQGRLGRVHSTPARHSSTRS